VLFITIRGALEVGACWMALEFEGLEVGAGARIVNVGWRLEDTRARSRRAEPIYLGLEGIALFVLNRLHQFDFFRGVATWPRVFILPVSLFSVHDRIKRRHTIAKTLNQGRLTYHSLFSLGSFSGS
jgi:hypothetical protein